MLLFDLSDYRTGWLRVTTEDTTSVVIQAGWSAIEGYAFRPSRLAETAQAIDDFTPVDGTVSTSFVGDLIATLTDKPQPTYLSKRTANPRLLKISPIAMADCIDSFDNRERTHSYLANISPTECKTLRSVHLFDRSTGITTARNDRAR